MVYFWKHIFLTLLLFNGSMAWGQDEVNVYSYRQRLLMQPLFDVFTKETGVKVKVVFAPKGLVERLRQEGSLSPADVLLTSDFSRLLEAEQARLLQSVKSAVLRRNVPRHLRDKDGRWFGLTVRARVLVVSRSAKGEIRRYEDLAKKEWHGRICSRSGQHSYNVSLLASMIAHHGVKEARSWARSVRSGLARKPQGNDRSQLKAIWQGQCDVSFVNTYYLGLVSKNPKQSSWGKGVRVVFPNQRDRGTHVNISGGGVVRYAPHRRQAVQLLEFLSGEKAQKLYVEGNFEYPVNKKVPLSPFLERLGIFKQDRIPIEKVATLRGRAVRIMDEVGWE